MRLFVDTNCLIAVVTDEPETAPVAAAVLDGDHEFVTSSLNLMELRAVLAKKHHLEFDRVMAIQETVAADVAVIIPDTSDVLAANRLQKETLLYPMDCLILACARNHDADLLTFDAELQEAGALAPADVLA